MTLDKLLSIDSAAWDRLTDDDLRIVLTPYFNVTRPPPSAIAQAKLDKLNNKSSKSGGSGKARVSTQSSQQLLDLARSLGMNIPTITPTKPTK